MRSFVDNAGRTWLIAINVWAVKQVRALVGVDLYALVDDQFQGLSKLLADPVALIDTIYVLCKADADRLGVSDEDFGRAMAGDALEHAATAFVEELVDFFPDRAVREALKKLVRVSKEVKTNYLKMAETALDEVDPAAVASKLIASSGGSPESSASIPTP